MSVWVFFFLKKEKKFGIKQQQLFIKYSVKKVSNIMKNKSKYLV